MSQHPAIAAGNVAVITGGASGIGLAAAKKLAGLGMTVVIFDRDDDSLNEAIRQVMGATKREAVVSCICVTGDVAKLADLERLRDVAVGRFGDVALLMNNAGIGRGGGVLDNPDGWRRVIETNLFGVLNGCQVFAQGMIDAGKPAAIVNTGSKQGITCPPGDTAYNVSKAGVKVLTEGLAHSLRNTEGCQVSAHLLVPGSTFTGMTRSAGGAKPPGAWVPDQVIDMLLQGMAAGDFYIICPDNEVTREIDNRRIQWAAEDIIRNRPALSRWHPDYKDQFAAFVAEVRQR